MLAKNIKRILVCFLAVLAVVSVSSQAVRADTNNGKSTAVARIGDTYYDSLEAAISAAREGSADDHDTIFLLSDYTVENTVTVNKNITFDAQSFTLSSNTMTMDVTGDAVLTFVGGTIESTSKNRAALYVGKQASVNMTGGTVKNTNGNSTMGAIRLSSYGASTISGGTVVTNGGKGAAVTCMNGSLTVSGDSTLIESKGAEPALRADYNSFGGNITVEGGTIKNSGSGFAARSETGGAITINGGTIQSSAVNKSVINSNGTFHINGGRFSDNAGNGINFECPEGKYLMDEDGDEWYELTDSVAVITKGGKAFGYPSLKAAVEAAADGDKIEIVADYTEPDLDGWQLTVERKSISIDLAGHTVNINGAIISDYATLTILDSSYEKNGTINFQNHKDISWGFLLTASALILKSGTCHTLSDWAVMSTPGIRGSSLEIGEDAKIIADGELAYPQIFTNSAILLLGPVIVRGTVESEVDAIHACGTATVYDGATVISKTGTALQTIYNDDAAINVEGGNITGAERGIKAGKGTVTVNGGIVKATAGDSVEVREGVTFNINGGAYSDDKGNADGFTRADGKKLFRSLDGLYRLTTEEAEEIDGSDGEHYTEFQEDAPAADAGDSESVPVDDIEANIIADEEPVFDPDEPVEHVDDKGEQPDPTDNETDNNKDTNTKEKEADNNTEKDPENKSTDSDNKSETKTEAVNKANVIPANTRKATNKKDASIITTGKTKGTAAPTTGDNGFIHIYIITAAGAALAGVLAGVGIKRRKRR